MKKIFKYSMLLIALLVGGNLYSQDFSDLQLVNRNLVIPPSPNASSLGSFGNYDVSYYTGALNLSIPVHTIQGRGISHGVSLSYNGSGNKVEATPSWVGLGWNLNAGGVITRTVQGNPDQDWNYYNVDPYNSGLGCIEMCEQNNSVAINEIETKPDLFTLSVGGISSTFIIQPNGQLVRKSRDGLKIIPHYGTTSFQQSDGSYIYQNEITSFSVIDQQGTQYTFDQQEQSTYILDDDNLNVNPRFYFFNSAWYVSEIRANMTTETIRLEYFDETVDEELPFNRRQHQYYSVPLGGIVTTPCPGEGPICGTGSNSQGQIVELGVTQVKILERKRLHKIIYQIEDDVETLVFNATSHNHHNYPGEHQLNSIDLYGSSAQGVPSTTLLKSWDFKYNTNTNRLMLESFQEGGNGSPIPAYTFDYNQTSLPTSLQSNAQDLWGYYNGKNGNSTLVPTIDGYGDGANRSVNAYSMKAGILETIHYPTGGSTSFEYESNTAVVKVWGNTRQEVGGLRITKVTTNDSDGSQIEEKTFTYKRPGSSDTGILFTQPSLTKASSFRSYTCPTITDGAAPCNTLYTCKKLNVFASSTRPLKMVNGSYVGYSYVEVKQTGIGKTIYQYRNDETKPSDFFANEDANGDLLQVEMLDVNDNPVQQTINSYSIDDNGNIQDGVGYSIQYPEAAPAQDNRYQLCRFTNSQGNLECQDQIECEQTSQYCDAGSCREETEYLVRGEIARPYFRYMTSSTTTDHFPDGTSVTVSKEYEYDNQYNTSPTAYTEFNSAGIFRTEVEYAHEMNAQQGGYAGFLISNRIAEPIRTKRYKSGTFILGSFTDHHTVGLRPKAMIQLYPNNIEVPVIADIQYDINGFPVSVQRYGEDFYHKQTFVWNNGRLLSTTNGTQQKTFTYKDNTRLVDEITDIDGTKVKHAYDGLWRVQDIFSKHSGGGQYEVTTSYKYDYHENAGFNGVSTTTAFTDDTPSQTSSETFDGIGRTLTSSVNGILKNQIIYDDKGRIEQQTYLPGSFTTLNYFDSPLNRLQSETYPDNTSITFEYSGEDNSFKTSTTDENGHTSSQLTDPIGRVLRSVDALGNETNFEYHPSGHIQTVKPPNWQDGNTYEYSYDERYRLEEKTIPSAGTSKYRYNDADQLVATSTTSYPYKWMVNVYDLYGRPIQSGFLNTPIANLNTVIPDPTLVTTETYYDTQGNIPSDAPSHTCPNGIINSGKVVASKVRVLEGNSLGDPMYTMVCYDQYGRNIEALSQNILDGQDLLTSTYDLADNVMTSIIDHSTTFNTAKISEAFTYDDFLMPDETRQQVIINGINHPEAFLSKLTFDHSLGQLVKKQLGGNELDVFLQDVDYQYNQRGWMTHINETTPQGGAEIPDCGDIIVTPCQLCDYTVSIFFADSKDVIYDLTYDGGASIPLVYPYHSWETNRLKGDLENWLTAEGLQFQEVQVYYSDNLFTITILQTKAVFNVAYRNTAGPPPDYRPISTLHNFTKSNCTTGGIFPPQYSVCDACDEAGYSCEGCPYFDIEDPCTTCTNLSFSDCTTCQYEADPCVQCANLGYTDCSTCPLTVDLIKPLKVRVEYNHATLNTVPLPTTVVKVEQEFINHKHDQSKQFELKDEKVLVGSGDLTNATPTHVFEIDISDQWIGSDNLTTVMSIIETKVTEELTIAGITDATTQAEVLKTHQKLLFYFRITDATTQAEVSQAVVQAASQNWNNATAASDIPYTTFNGDLFSMELFYSESDAMISSDAQYNGNVRGMKWQVVGKSVQSYSFDYDDINRLELGLYKERLQDGSLTTKNKYGVEMAYDAVGNITRLQRRGLSDICYGETLTPSYVFDDIDDLRYTIGNQNRLTNIVEAENQNYGYKGQGGDYQYDGAGNITYDANKDMTIVYNYMNLPSLVTFNQTNSTIKFTYDTAGNKLKKESNGTDSNGNSVNYIQYYIGGIEYKNETIEAINNAEGRCVVIEDDEVRYEYNLTDHLGNVRVTFSDLDNSGKIEASETLGSNEILQENHYYPFGMQMDGPWQQIVVEPENHYLYNGKELNDDFDLNWLDYGARWYDPSIARWNAIDPMAEEFYEWSPYNYVYNNPLIYTDPTGMAGDLTHGATIYLKKGDDISDEQFMTSVLSYITNVANVWAGDNGQDLGNIKFQFASDGFDADHLGENENLLTFGGGDEVSHVTGDNNNVGFMNIADGGNTAAHEFGHFLGLEDRYYEGVNWDQSSGDLTRKTTPIPGAEIDDHDYNPADNLYSNNSSTLTPAQIRIANSSAVESDHQKGRGYLYKNDSDKGREAYRVVGKGGNRRVKSKGKILGRKKKDRSASRIRKHIKKSHK